MDGQLDRMLNPRPARPSRRTRSAVNSSEMAERHEEMRAQTEALRATAAAARQRLREHNQGMYATFGRPSRGPLPLAKRRLKLLLPPPREVTKRWVTITVPRAEVGPVLFDVELSLRHLDRVAHCLTIHPERRTETLAAVVLIGQHLLHALPGQPVPPLARIIAVIDAGPEPLGEALEAGQLTADIEAARALLRAGEPVLTPG